MERLTRGEEEVMRAVWAVGRGSLGDVRAVLAQAGHEHKPTTIGTVLRILVRKGYVRYEQYGRTHVYEPAVAQGEYSASRLDTFIERFFGGSPAALVSFLAARENLSLREIEALLDAEDDSGATSGPHRRRSADDPPTPN